MARQNQGVTEYGEDYRAAEFRMLYGLETTQKTLNQWKHKYYLRIWPIGTNMAGDPITLVARERIPDTV